MLRIKFDLKLGGQPCAANAVEIALYPPRQTANLPTLAVSDSRLAAHARLLGYQVIPNSQADVTLVHAQDAANIFRLQSGARYVVLADVTEITKGNHWFGVGRREQPFIPIVDDIPANPANPANPKAQLPNIALIARTGTIWRSDWIASFTSIRRDGPFAMIPGGPMMDLSMSDVIPHHVMTGFWAWEFDGAVQAGLVVGWMHKPRRIDQHPACGAWLGGGQHIPAAPPHCRP